MLVWLLPATDDLIYLYLYLYFAPPSTPLLNSSPHTSKYAPAHVATVLENQFSKLSPSYPLSTILKSPAEYIANVSSEDVFLQRFQNDGRIIVMRCVAWAPQLRSTSKQEMHFWSSLGEMVSGTTQHWHGWIFGHVLSQCGPISHERLYLMRLE